MSAAIQIYYAKFDEAFFKSLVPKLYLGTCMSLKLHFRSRMNGEAELRGKLHSQVQLGNEGTGTNE